ncbi:hypothetical protein NDU88_004883 [Pleurodeles waltl]|uniref:Uncharacterized protein n=1 Tax=Pleurodeles waltl TaxID=8319 RepID=A0AAV7T9D2_PLEWA|nr:hypothetical protein NDU88_004883 [Pleurodeles waltl]
MGLALELHFQLWCCDGPAQRDPFTIPTCAGAVSNAPDSPIETVNHKRLPAAKEVPGRCYAGGKELKMPAAGSREARNGGVESSSVDGNNQKTANHERLPAAKEGPGRFYAGGKELKVPAARSREARNGGVESSSAGGNNQSKARSEEEADGGPETQEAQCESTGQASGEAWQPQVRPGTKTRGSRGAGWGTGEEKHGEVGKQVGK